ncbi:ABC transporter substrate-binding protein [Martelella soudanensis]|uniref:ABC transporter substrate-binding protein n=1 Tax=unclassified Martelella TaxID=2629616 RepID=UPI0015DDB4CA|nr:MULTISPECIES: sugar ABC transporter substrate-binding protein [unclassified Martelella]
MKRFTQKAIFATLTVFSAQALHAQDIDWSSDLGSLDGTSLVISTITDPFIDSMEETIPEFTALTGADVTIDGFGYDALHDRQLLGCSQNDGSTDVLVIDGIWMGEFVEAGCLEPLDDRIAADEDSFAWDDFVADGATQASWDGTRYCAPIGIYYGLMFYRTDLFEAAGLDVPETFDELKEAAAFFTDNPDFPGVYGYAMNNQRGAAAGQQYFEWAFSAGVSPWKSNTIGAENPYADLTPTMNGERSVELVQFFKDMTAYGPPGVESYAWDERATGFANGSLAMINDWSVRAQIAEDPATSQISGKFAAALMPHAEGEKTISPVGGWVMCMNAHSEQKGAAWDLIRWFSSPDVHKEFVLAGGPPSRVSAMEDADIQAKWPWTVQLNEARQTAWAEGRPRHPLTFQLIDETGVEVNRAIIGEKTPQQAMDDANAQAEKMLQRAGLL